ncbi:hypothetical protein ACEPAF_6352 [Sanghuangporus sanghuang]
MAQADSVSVFAEGTYEEQIQELVDYVAQTKPESERGTFKESFINALKISVNQKTIDEDEGRKRDLISKVIDALDNLGDGPEREIEGFYNLLFSHLLALNSPDSQELQKNVSKVVTVISQQVTTEQSSLKYRILANLFNIIPRTSPARLSVCKTLLKVAQENDELESLRLTATDVDRWLIEWGVSAEEKSDFLKSIADAFASVGQFETAFAFSISHVRSLPTSASVTPSLELIASALRIPSMFGFNSLLELESVQALGSNELFDLLVIFHKHGLEDFRAWQQKNKLILDEYRLDTLQLERKLRLLLLSEIGFSKIGHDILYDEIASALQIEPHEVEKWVIDAIRAGLLSGKLSQSTQALHVVRASPRSFALEQWEVLERRLLAWKDGLAGIQSVLCATRQSTNAAVVPEQTA